MVKEMGGKPRESHYGRQREVDILRRMFLMSQSQKIKYHIEQVKPSTAVRFTQL